MNIRIGNMFDNLHEYDLTLATGNSTIKRDGSLVMGAGAALEMARRFPGCDAIFGRRIEAGLSRPINNNSRMYGVVTITQISGPNIGLFQTKRHFAEKSSIVVIAYAVTKLLDDIRRDQRIALNYPGIGCGQLSEAEVAPVIARLPDNVDAWKLEG